MSRTLVIETTSDGYFYVTPTKFSKQNRSQIGYALHTENYSFWLILFWWYDINEQRHPANAYVIFYIQCYWSYPWSIKLSYFCHGQVAFSWVSCLFMSDMSWARWRLGESSTSLLNILFLRSDSKANLIYQLLSSLTLQ